MKNNKLAYSSIGVFVSIFVGIWLLNIKLDVDFKVTLSIVTLYTATIIIFIFLKHKAVISVSGFRWRLIYITWILSLMLSIRLIEVELLDLPKKIHILFGVCIIIAGFSGIAINDLGHYLTSKGDRGDSRRP